MSRNGCMALPCGPIGLSAVCDCVTSWSYSLFFKGAQWLSGRVLDSRPRGRGFEPHRRHCVVFLEHGTFILA